MKRLYKVKIPAVAIIVMALVVPLIIFLAVANDSIKPGLEIGSQAPEISGETLSGENESLSAILAENKWVVVNFFASWCPPCVEEHREFVRLKNESEYSLEIISVLFNESPAKGRDFFNTYGGNWPAFIRNTTSIAIQYRILSVPETYLVTPAGYVAAHWRGPINATDITERIEEILTGE